MSEQVESLKDFWNWQPPKFKEIIGNNILIPQSKIILCGKYKSWKSMMVMHTAFCIATGRPWFGYPTVKTCVLLVQEEITKSMFWKRLIKYCLGAGLKTEDISKIDTLFFANNPKIQMGPAKSSGFSILARMIQQVKPEVVILDPLYRILAGRQTDEFDVKGFIAHINALSEAYNCAFIIVHHQRLTQRVEGVAQDFGADDMYGSSIIPNWMDGEIKLAPTLKDGEVVIQFNAFRHNEEELLPMMWQIDRANLQWSRTDVQ